MLLTDTTQSPASDFTLHSQPREKKGERRSSSPSGRCRNAIDIVVVVILHTHTRVGERGEKALATVVSLLIATLAALSSSTSRGNVVNKPYLPLASASPSLTVPQLLSSVQPSSLAHATRAASCHPDQEHSILPSLSPKGLEE